MAIASGIFGRYVLSHVPRRRAVPLGRMGQPTEIAGTVAWLLSEDAGGVTGQASKYSNGQAFAGPVPSASSLRG